MPALVIFKLPQHPNKTYDAYDIAYVMPAKQHPGTGFEEEPWDWGFVYITDRSAGQLSHLVESLYSDTENPDDPGDFRRLKKRRRKIKPELLPDEAQFRRYRPFAAPEAVKVSMDDLELKHVHDKHGDT